MTNKNFFTLKVVALFCLFLTGIKPVEAINLDSLVSISNNPNINALDRQTALYLRGGYEKEKNLGMEYLKKASALYPEAKNDSMQYKIEVLIAYRYQYKFKQNEEANKHYLTANTLAQKSGIKILQAEVQDYIIKFYYANKLNKELDSLCRAQIEFTKNLIENNPINDKRYKYFRNAIKVVSSNYVTSADYKKASEKLFSLAEIVTQVGDTVSLITIKINTATLFLRIKDYKEGEHYLNEAKDLALKIHDKHRLALILTNLGSLYTETNHLAKADSLFKQALSIRLTIGPNSSIAGLYENIGIIAKKQGDPETAIQYYNVSLKLREKGKYYNVIANSYANLGRAYLDLKKYRQSEEHLLKGLEYSYNYNSKEARLAILKTLSELYSTTQRHKKAYETLIQFKALDDSLHSLSTEKVIKELQEKYEAKEKDLQILDFEKQQHIDALNIEKKAVLNNFLFAIIAFTIITAILIFVVIDRKRKNEKLLFQKNQELAQQKMLDLVKEQEMNSINSFISGQERERSRIASELHDRLGSLLSTVKLHFSAMEEDIEKNDEIKESYQYAISLLDQSVGEVRSVSHNLAKEILTEFGLVGAIENLQQAINSAGSIEMIFHNSGFDEHLTYEVEIEIYRIIQELVTNCIKHANANELVVQFVVTDDNLNVTVEDNGKGFNPEKVSKNGLGLTNVTERANKINARFSVDSSPGRGATFMMDIPLTK